ncbi:thrombospondin type-1 domain-containing protein 4 isoform X2 [Folsomia candida]|uniref:Thrombospondin type-1 domain-containing protein 4 n=1 Tax=Folsomia candida TaxID=158441 RepID=A0A226EXA2_FOLCA|nr:thrombospondin type-1 domain-containing protein 4 isoform X2 [Folsomia candida]OXA61246.1 Thrombospondin type-1 domain-containing protein 4 [Folsomia candida]
MKSTEKFARLNFVAVVVALFFLNPIGCDGVAGSQRRLDRCGVCGGDDSNCRVVSGIFTRPQLPVGYSVVAHLPRGACNLNITQLRKSANRLALRKSDGTFILNGDWRLSWPGVYDGAGTKFYYARQEKLLESIASAGPLNEAVDLMVLYQQPNPGIKYEYMLPLGDTPIPPVPVLDPLATLVGTRHQSAATYRPTSYVNNNLLPNGNSANAFNTISSFPKPSPSVGSSPNNNGQQLLLYPGDSASPFSVAENQATHPHLHGHHHSRRRDHNLNKLPRSDKKFYWKTIGYTNCTELCGGGTQRSIIRCVKSPAANAVSDRRCAGEEKPVGQTIRCNLKPCPAEWEVGTWSACSEHCGDGLKTRPVFCNQRISPTLTMRVAEGACLKVKPESQTKCFVKPCHRWESSEWSQCSAKCGNGIRRRQMECTDANGKKIDPKDCDDAERPTEILPCNMGPCDGTDWFMSEWSSDCSQKCGGGVQTRHVVCSGNHHNFTGRRRPLSAESETNSIEDEDQNEDEPAPTFHCDESKRPSEERECFSDKQCGDPAWYTGEWSECSTSCGNGLKTRILLCVIFSRGKFKVVEETLCPLSQKPEGKLQCESNRLCSDSWFNTEWSECSVPCGGGTQKRSVSCRAGNWTKPSSFCADINRPLDKRYCNEHKCSKITDPSGMVKDTSPNTLIVESDEIENSNLTIIRRFENEQLSPTISTTTQTQPKDKTFVEEPEDSECTDQYRNCPLVLQARLCTYKYYRSVCCNSCAQQQHEFHNKN